MTPLTIKVKKYVDKILRGEIPAGKFVALACKRWEADWSRDDIYFDEQGYLHFVSFAATFSHFKGEKAGTPIILEDWELFIAANVFGWKYKKTKKRRYNIADVYVARKNGKTTLAALIALYLLIYDDEPGAEVYAAAVDKEQARICFEAAKELLKKSVFGEYTQTYRGSIVDPETASAFKPLSKDTKNKDGLNPHGAICDERHAWKTNEIYDVIKTGMGARTQPLLFSISTAGMDTSVPYFEDLQVMRDILLGTKIQDNHFVLLFEPDEGDRWDDETTWLKANPNLGVSLSWDYMRRECEDAKIKGGTTLAAFCTKNLNMWVDTPDVWIPDDLVLKNNAPFDTGQLAWQDCYVGIDLASKSDITATALFFPRFNVARFLFVVPEAKVKEMEDRVDYRRWSEQGWLTVTPGNTLDQDWYISFLLNELAQYKVKCIAYDPWGMWDIVPKLKRYERELMEYQQNIRYMSVPTKHLESEIRKGNLNFLDNPIMRWMLGNVTIYIDPNANIKLDKSRSRNKIDGVVALVDAIGGWLTKEGGKKSAYHDHGLRSVKM